MTLRRLCIVLSCKDAYIKAIGQPVGFDYRRLEFNIPEEKATGDGHPLTGWEFRIFKAQLGVSRRGQIVQEDYQCVCAQSAYRASSRAAGRGDTGCGDGPRASVCVPGRGPRRG